MIQVQQVEKEKKKGSWEYLVEGLDMAANAVSMVKGFSGGSSDAAASSNMQNVGTGTSQLVRDFTSKTMKNYDNGTKDYFTRSAKSYMR